MKPCRADERSSPLTDRYSRASGNASRRSRLPISTGCSIGRTERIRLTATASGLDLTQED